MRLQPAPLGSSHHILALGGWICLLVVCGFVGVADAKCKAHHTRWKVAGQGPLVSQPVSRSPEKVKVSWSGLLDNQRCVDWYTVSYWRTGLDDPNNPLQVKSLNVTGPQNSSLVVTVQPCNEYSFQVQFSQQSFWRSKIHQYKSGVTKFKTQGIPSIKPTFDWRYDLEMYYQLEDGVHNLRKPVVAFRKNDLLVNGDCVSEVVVRQVLDPHLVSETLEDVYVRAQNEFKQKYLDTEETTNNRGEHSHHTTAAGHNHHYGDEGHFDPNQGVYRHQMSTVFADLKPNNSTARCPVRKCPVCRHKREVNGQTGQTFFGQQQQQGEAGQATSSSWNGQTFNSKRGGGGGGYGGTYVDATSGNNAHKRPDHGGGRGRSSPGNQERKPRSVGTRKPFVDPKTAKTPPFRNELVEIAMDTSRSEELDTCRHGLVFDFEVNANNGRNLYRVRKVHFPLVHQVTRFVPPTLSMVLHELLHGQGRKVPDSCIPLYMMAIDGQVRGNHAAVEFYQGQYEKLEDLTHKKLEHSHREKTPIKPGGSKPKTRTALEDHNHETDHLLSDRDHHKKKTMLKKLGCLCHWSEFIKVNVSDANANYYYPNTTGIYEFSGRTYDGKPYYTRNATTNAGGSSPDTTYYLYYYQPQRTWYIDDNLGDSSPKLSVVGAYERCPGDMSILKMTPPGWQYVKSLVWYNVKHTSVSCGVL